MPRRRKTISGDTAQNIESVQGQRYGEGKEQTELQEALPAPIASSAIPANGAGPNVQQPQAQAKPGPEDMAAFLQANNPRLLSGTQRPDEPLTAGLDIGPGAGSSDMQMGLSTTPIARTLLTLSRETGNPKWRELAERAGL